MLKERVLLCLIAFSGFSLYAMEPEDGPEVAVIEPLNDLRASRREDDRVQEEALLGNQNLGIQDALREIPEIDDLVNEIAQDMPRSGIWNQANQRTSAGFGVGLLLYLVLYGVGEHLLGIDVFPLLFLTTFGAIAPNAYTTLFSPDSQLVKRAAGNVLQGSTEAVTALFTNPRLRPGERRDVAHYAPGIKLIKSVARALKEEWKKDGDVRLAIESLFQVVFDDEGIVRDAVKHMKNYLETDLSDFIKKIISDDNSPIQKALHQMVDRLRQEGQETARVARLELMAAALEFRQNLRDAGEEVRQAIGKASLEANAGIDQIGETITGKHWKRLVTTAVLGGIVLITAWYGSKSLWGYVDRVLGRPSLVQESSFGSFFDKAPWFGRKKVLPRMVFSADLKERLNGIAKATRHIRERIKEGQGNLKYRNLLLYGDPGVGKTMFARVLAQFSGMDYAIMSGASFSQFTNGEGITEMNKLIQWGRQNANGLMIIIDEAEAFLGARMQNSKDYKVTKESYQLLTNFLHLTGERSDKIMFVFCTNRQEALDPAMKRRIDDAVQLDLPGHEERVGIVQLYRNEILLDPADNTEQFMQAVKTYLTDEVIHDIAKKTAGLSGGELEGIINTLVSDAAITEDGLISAQLVDKVVQRMIDKHVSFAKVFHTGAAAA